MELYYNHIYLTNIILSNNQPNNNTQLSKRQQGKKFIQENIKKFKELLKTKLKGKVKKIDSNTSLSSPSVYYNLKILGLPKNHPMENITVRISDHNINQNTKYTYKEKRNDYSISQNEGTPEEFLGFVDTILQNQKSYIYSINITRKKIGTQTIKKGEPKMPLYQYDIVILTDRGKFQGTSTVGVTSALDAAFRDTNIENLTSEEVDDIKTRAKKILDKKIAMLEYGEKDTDNITAVLKIVRDKYDELNLKELKAWIYYALGGKPII